MSAAADRRGRSLSRTPPRSMSRSRSPSYSRSPSRSPAPRGGRNYSPRGRSPSYSRSPVRSPSRSPSPRGGTTKTVLIKHLTKNVREAHLEEIFGVYGLIKDVDLPINRRSGFHRGSATITYDTTTAADKAVDHMDRGMIDSAVVDVLPGKRGDALPPLPPPAAPPARERERSLSPFSRRAAMSGGLRGGPPGRGGFGGPPRGGGRPYGPPRGRSPSRSPPPRRARSPPRRRRYSLSRSPVSPRSRSRSFSPPPRRRRADSRSLSPPRGPRGGGRGMGRRPSPSYGRSPPRYR